MIRKTFGMLRSTSGMLRKTSGMLRFWGVTVLCLFLSLLIVFFLQRRSAKHGPVVFGSTYMTMNNPYFTTLNDSIRDSIEANGDILLTRDPAQNQERQNRQILDMIDEGMTVLFANPVDKNTIGPALLACREAGVAVFIVDTDVEEAIGILSVIQSDNYRAGVLIAEDLLKKRPEGADILIIGDQSIVSMTERYRGFTQRLENEKGFRIFHRIDGVNEIETANQAMDDYLRGGEAPEVIFGLNDPTALGALAALISNKKEPGEILVYGVDGSPDGKKMIQKGQMAATAAQHPIIMGRTAVELAYSYLEGEMINEQVLIPVELINSDTVNDFAIEQWQ